MSGQHRVLTGRHRTPRTRFKIGRCGICKQGHQVIIGRFTDAIGRPFDLCARCVLNLMITWRDQ